MMAGKLVAWDIGTIPVLAHAAEQQEKTNSEVTSPVFHSWWQLPQGRSMVKLLKR